MLAENLELNPTFESLSSKFRGTWYTSQIFRLTFSQNSGTLPNQGNPSQPVVLCLYSQQQLTFADYKTKIFQINSFC